MRTHLRRKLTIQFVLLFVLLYFSGGAFALVLFANQMDASLDGELHELVNETMPSMDFTSGLPSLKNWASRAQARHDKLLCTVQVFDRERRILEEFGPAGNPSLDIGSLPVIAPSAEPFTNVRSYFVEIHDGARLIGYLQVQVSMKQRDEALKEIVLTMVALTPFLALAVAICGSWFAGNAVKPVEDTLSLLRQFVADAAHEINTPITVIEASLQTLSAELGEEEAAASRHVLQIIERATGRMKALGRSLILLSRMESSDYKLPVEKLSLASIVDPVYEECEQLARVKGVLMHREKAPSVSLMGNRESLERMVLNLLSNAVNYTEAGGNVYLKFTVSDHDFQIIVQDEGVGIPPESIDKVFERFYRVDRSRSREAGGFGIGLSLVKAIVERHQGTIELTSEVGKGSCFSVKLNAS